MYMYIIPSKASEVAESLTRRTISGSWHRRSSARPQLGSLSNGSAPWLSKYCT